MSSVYSTQLLAWSADETPPGYTVPAGYVVVVRDADVTSGGGSMINYQMEIAGGAVFWRGLFTEESIGQSAQWRGRQVLNAGQSLVFASDGATDGVVSGYLLGIIP